jgi:mannose-6-phosphate isomerase-like protein (cupin superfamily)
MKDGVLHFTYFTTGDYVRTPEGVGIVCEDEKVILEETDFCTSEVKVQHKFKSSNNTPNRPIEIVREYVSRTTKEDYDSEASF